MPKYYEGEAVVKAFTETTNQSATWARGILASMEDADVEPIRHAHWIPLYGRMYACNDKKGEIVQTGYKCSACGREEEDRWQICRCGARMDEEETP